MKRTNVNIPKRIAGLTVWLSASAMMVLLGLHYKSSQGVHAAGKISSISVCANTPNVFITPKLPEKEIPYGFGQGSCPPDQFDTGFMVLAPGGSQYNQISIDSATGLQMGTAVDEHPSVIPPYGAGKNSDYLFFLASGVGGLTQDQSIAISALVTASAGPTYAVTSQGDPVLSTGIWSMKFPSPPESYGLYRDVCGAGCDHYGAVFRAPLIQGPLKGPQVCPTAGTDDTFDLKYAAPGSVVQDPHDNGHLLMIYEGSNTCFKKPYTHGVSIGVATSFDNGFTWPTYCGNSDQCPQSSFEPFPLPGASSGPSGPYQTHGAWGGDVCMGNTCDTPPKQPPVDYGRYEVLRSDKYPQAWNQEPSAFEDDVHGAANPDLYVVYTADHDLSMARATIKRGARLAFDKWNGTGFTIPGLGNPDTPVLNPMSFEQCGDRAHKQERTAGSITYVEDTNEYLLLFLCSSPNDPQDGYIPCSGANCPAPGVAWFWATTSSLADLQDHPWQVAPGGRGEIIGTWNVPTTSGVVGLYPSFMSLGGKIGHLNLKNLNFSFYMNGCYGKCVVPGPRVFSSRVLAIQ